MVEGLWVAKRQLLLGVIWNMCFWDENNGWDGVSEYQTASIRHAGTEKHIGLNGNRVANLRDKALHKDHCKSTRHTMRQSAWPDDWYYMTWKLWNSYAMPKAILLMHVFQTVDPVPQASAELLSTCKVLQH